MTATHTTKIPDQHGNIHAAEGCDRCECGCKYWENDRCVDCGAAWRQPTHLMTGSSTVRCGWAMRLGHLHPDGWDLGNVSVEVSDVTCPECMDARPGLNRGRA